jgi:flagellar motor switch protein FliG
MANIKEVSPETADEVIREFQQRMSSVTAQGDRLLKNALSKVMGEKRARRVNLSNIILRPTKSW